MNMALILALIGSCIVTSYRSVPAQTDKSPFRTSTGEIVSPDGVAVSQDLLCKACLKLHRRCKHPEVSQNLHYGNWLYIEGVGFKRINDVMNKRHKNRLDVWVNTLKDEKEFFKAFGLRPLKVYKV